MFQETGSYYHFLDFPFYYCKCRYVNLPTWSFSFNSGIKFIMMILCHKINNEEAEGRKKNSFFPLNIETGPKNIDRISNQHICSLMHPLYRFASYHHSSRDSYDSKLKSHFKSLNIHYTCWGLSKQRQKKSTTQIHIYPLGHCNKTHIGSIIFPYSLEMCMPEM